MNPIIAFIKRQPQPIFWAIAWSTAFIGFYMQTLYPSDLWMFMIYGSFLGGALVTGIADGRSGLKTYFSRIVRWRVGLRWYLVVLILPLALRLAALGLLLATGTPLPGRIEWPGAGDLVAGFILILLVIGLGEEPGFRGFALPRLMQGRSALAASLILGVLHSIWHLPLILSGEELPVLVVIVISGAVLLTWLFNHTNGSVWMVMLFHAFVNLWRDVFNPLFAGADLAKQTNWLAAAYVAAAVLLVALAGPELGRRRQAAAPVSERAAADRSLAAE